VSGGKWTRDLKLRISRMYRSGRLKLVWRELTAYRLDSKGVQEVRWDKGGRNGIKNAQ
jgi:hypothetical protein